jgi:acetoin utilization deacetylase AcuC-like enzyme
VKVFYSPAYEVALPGHIWPTSKYRLVAESLAESVTLMPPAPASWDELALVHTSDYLNRLRHGGLTAEEIATLELPWRSDLIDLFCLMTGGTVAAARTAVSDGRSAHLGGGLHHAFANHGEGFCPVNDVAVAVRVLQASGALRRAAIVDLDVHHGNGTAMIFERDPSVFTFSMHQQHNYPMFKPRSDLDVGLADGTGDAEYLDRLHAALPRVTASGPDLVVYLAGADPYGGDQLGGLALTKSGLAERDRLVCAAAREAGVPLAVVLAGGYAADARDTAEIHTATVRTLLDSGTPPA